MPPQLILTKDGSHTVEAADGVTYHSTFGALQESEHIFIREGLRAVMREQPRSDRAIRVFEMGFGTGLNALLSLLIGETTGRMISYETVERNPLPAETTCQLNYCRQLQRPDRQKTFDRLHTAAWDVPVQVTPGFSLYKVLGDGRGYHLRETADLVYYDAFDPVVQPELWTPVVFERLWGQMAPGSILVTYCCKGSVRRALREIGFTVEKLPGPPGKREMLRARKLLYANE